MSAQIVPKRFGLKYSPKPAIALEYQTLDAGLAILEVIVDELSPRTHDVEGVVNALQKEHPFHLGPNVVSANQLERLVARLLFEGRAHLPEGYLTPAGMAVDKPQMESSSPAPPSSLGYASPSKPRHLPKAEGYDSDHSGGLSSGPTPAPTPETQRATRDPSDSGGSVTSDPASPRSDGVESVEGGKKHGRDPSRASLSLACTQHEVQQQRLPIAMAASAPAAAASALAGENSRCREEEEIQAEKNSNDEDDEKKKDEKEEEEEAEADADAEEAKEEEQAESREVGARGQMHCGASYETGGKSRIFASFGSTLSKFDSSYEAPETDTKQTEDESTKYREHRNGERKIDLLSTFSTTSVTTTPTASFPDEEPDRKKSSGDNHLRDEGRGDYSQEEQEVEAEAEEGSIHEIEEKDDEIPEDAESEENYEKVNYTNDGGNQLTSERHKRHAGADDAGDNFGATASADGGDVEMGAGGTKAVENDNDDHKEDELVSPGATERGARGADSRTTLAGNATQMVPPTPTSTIASDVTPTLQDSSEEETTSSPPSLFALSRGKLLTPPSPAAGRGEGASPLAGLPLPPMGGAGQRHGLLGSLRPVGGRGLPSLTLPAGRETAGSTGEAGAAFARTAQGDEINITSNATAEATGGALASGASSPISSYAPPAAGSPTADTRVAAESEPLRLPRDGGSAAEFDSDGDASDGADGADIGGGGGGDGSGGSEDGPARRSLTRGAEEEEDQKLEELKLRARLGLGQDEMEDESEDEEDSGGEGEEDGGKGENQNERSGASSPDSPRQHQGQEEEDAGRTSAQANLRGEEKVDAPIGTGGSGDYFGDSDEDNDGLGGDASSIDEDISFEQETVGSDIGGAGTGDDDYFS